MDLICVWRGPLLVYFDIFGDVDEVLSKSGIVLMWTPCIFLVLLGGRYLMWVPYAKVI